MPKTVKQPTITIPHFTGSTAKDFRTHKMRLRSIFDTLGLLKIFDGINKFLADRSRRR